MITTKIFDLSGHLLTGQQVLTTPDYTVQTYQSGVLKKSEDHQNKAFVHGTYYVDNTENLQDVINNVVIASGKTWAILTNRQIANSYSQWDLGKYTGDGQLAWKGIQVFDSKNWTIMFMSIEIQTNQPAAQPQKYFYGNRLNNETDDCLLMFNYNNDGTLDRIYDYNDNWNYAWRGMSIDEFLVSPIADDFSFEDHPYYQSLQPYLPASETV